MSTNDPGAFLLPALLAMDVYHRDAIGGVAKMVEAAVHLPQPTGAQ